MSLNGKSCGLELSPNVHATRTLYCPQDQALDVEASNLKEYERTCDRIHVEFRPGYTPVEFECRPVSWEVFRRALADCDHESAYNVTHDVFRELFRVGCLAVRNWTYSKNGKDLPFLIQHKARPGQLSRMSDETFAQIADSVAVYVGGLIYNMSGLPKLFSEWIDSLKSLNENGRSPPKEEHIKN